MRALIVVDVQNDFANPSGSLYVKDGEKIVPIINKLTHATLERNEIMVFTGDWHSDNSPHFQKWPVHCVAGTIGAAFCTELTLPRGSVIIHKGISDKDGYSGFDKEILVRTIVADNKEGLIVFTGCLHKTKNNLHYLLKTAKIEEVIIAGLATDYCVKATALEAVRLGFKTKVVIDACRAVNLNPGDEEKAIEEMKAAGVEIVTSEDVLAGRA